MAKQKNPRLTTPKGVFKFPRLTQPDFKFDPAQGAYSVKLLLDPAQKGVSEFIERIDSETDKAVALMKEENAKHAKKIVRQAAYKMEEDDDGNETGKIEMGFSMKAKVTAKKGANAGKVFEFKPALFDSFGKPIVGDVKIGGGTVGKVSFEYFPYFSANDKKAGLSRRLQAAQIIELVEWNSGGSAKSYGFDDEDEGYSSSTTPGNATDDTEEEDDTTDTTNAADF